jgi:flagellar M-ring protein FliF
MKKYEALIKMAVGYNEDRNDKIEVVNVQFHEIQPEEITVTERISQQVDLQNIITYIVTALLFALFFVFGLRPMMRLLTKTIETAMVPAPALPSEGEEYSEHKVELPPGLRIPGAEEMTDRQSQLILIAQKNPRVFAQYLKGWMEP